MDTKRRPLLVLIFIMLVATALTSRLIFWQVMQHAPLSADVRRQEMPFVQPPVRGQILASNGTPLATDVTRNLVWVDPSKVKRPHRTAVELAPVLDVNVNDLEKILVSNENYVQLAPEVSDGVTAKIRNLALPGVVLEPVLRRVYPGNNEASQLLGFVNQDNQGQYGLEGEYNSMLAGTAGIRSVLKDTAGNDIKVTAAASVPSHDGAQLRLTIDSEIQSLAEHEIRSAVTVHHADSGSVLIMDPRTGYVLAMASTPDFNPNRFYKVTNATLFQNPAVEMQYEPGSTFKIITMAAGLDTGVITPQTSFDDTGTWMVDGIALHNWNMAGFGEENMTQVLQHSANVGASFVASKLGTTSFYNYVRRFKFGQLTGIDTENEISGHVLTPSDSGWTPVSLYTNAFGQGIAVTPIQMIRAVSAVANGGIMMKPRLVEQVTYGGRIIERPPVRVGRVISAKTAHTLTNMLVHSAVGGEASEGLVKGYNIAAKTGTANIAGPDGGYIPNDTIGSIIGYAPAFHPRFVVLVIINHPRDQPWGSTTAAPVLHNLMQELFLHYHIAPNPHAIYK